MGMQYTGWYFKDLLGATHYFKGTSQSCIPNLKAATIESGFTALSTDGLYSITTSGTTGVVVDSSGVTGYLDNKFLVVGVTYAPPGPQSFVNYMKGTQMGTTNTLSSSFATKEGVTYTEGAGITIPGVFAGKLTESDSLTTSETVTNSSGIALTFSVVTGFETFGTASIYPGIPNSVGFAPVDNDYDMIWVWLNPVTIFTVAGKNVAWNGYGYDENDINGLDIVPIPLGYLNGHFGPIPPDIQVSLNRAWAAPQMWAAGQGPALTASDLAQIAATDPFSVSTYGAKEIGYVPPSPETNDQRFTMSACTNGQQDVPYLQAEPGTTPAAFTCTITNTIASTQTQDDTDSYQQAFSVDQSFSNTFFWVTISSDILQTQTLTWTSEALVSNTATATSTAALSVQGPSCTTVVLGVGPCIPEYDQYGNEPVAFDVYQDNKFGTFMFAPIHYY
jgi:hypothetical protein